MARYGHDMGNPDQKKKTQWMIYKSSLPWKLTETNIEVTSIRDILNPKYLPIVELELSKSSSKLVGLLFLVTFFNVHESPLCD